MALVAWGGGPKSVRAETKRTGRDQRNTNATKQNKDPLSARSTPPESLARSFDYLNDTPSWAESGPARMSIKLVLRARESFARIRRRIKCCLARVSLSFPLACLLSVVAAGKALSKGT